MVALILLINRGQKPSFFIRKSDVTPFYEIGDVVRTLYGTGTIQSIREDGTHVVNIQSWKLANNTSPILYLQSNSLTKEVFRHRPLSSHLLRRGATPPPSGGSGTQFKQPMAKVKSLQSATMGWLWSLQAIGCWRMESSRSFI
jgi:hypothetical protein